MTNNIVSVVETRRNYADDTYSIILNSSAIYLDELETDTPDVKKYGVYLLGSRDLVAVISLEHIIQPD